MPVTHVMIYQDETGAIHSSRITTTNEDIDERLRVIRLQDVVKAWGWDLISIQKIDELSNEIPSPADSWRSRWLKHGYRTLLVAILIMNIVAVAWDYRQEVRMERNVAPFLKAWFYEHPEAKQKFEP